ncbi:MAG: phytanoyl-CoA dioxygenase family protein [Verrucomicrobia bacterium]|nr:phytanoyl-CoA dioxygenase family protein [Verrucomicrobiota bacterium]
MEPTERDIYFFDLRGYLILEKALSCAEVRELNSGLDAIPPMTPGEWYGYIQSHTFSGANGINLQQIYEAGEPFEKLIDHPSWFEKVRHFVGGEGTFDCSHGPLFIDENFASLRKREEGIFPHSGGWHAVKRCQFLTRNGKFQCGQINILIALTDIGPDDGATVVVPGSHKSNFPHPDVDIPGRVYGETSSASVDGAQEVHLKAGDALLFVDAICHGAVPKKSDGQRRIVVYRYGPSWGNFRHGYQPSPELLARLTPQRRNIVQPLTILPREPQVQSHNA